ncbi:unnamed protein product [Rotaria sp. Silwood2]|nr:unnamed protein product [Rotaria sp. Silwood2]CAF2966071.1 unnamed protein product [Rotaria sp. Silwood2]CAF4045185.1 unnamed protein product [Rotaria sp. Silwood2]CAF4281105.1 unnamed protein product [Rotaria sp. Silwood2]
MIHSIDVSKSNHRKKHSYKTTRKSHYHRSGKKFNAKKSKKKTHHHRNSIEINFNQSSIDKNTLDEKQNNNDILFDTHNMVRDHLYISIIGVLCFFPTGIFGLIRSMQANEMKRSSSILYWPKLAAIYGRYALRWAILSILIGTMFWTIFIIYYLLREQHILWDAYYQECGEQFLCSP